MRSVVLYSVLRVLAFLVPFGLLMLFPAFQELPWLAALFAAIIGLALSILFLRRPLEAVSTGLSERRATRRSERADADVEDEADDAARAASTGGTDVEGVTYAGSATDDVSATQAEEPDAVATDADEAPGQPTNAQNSSPA